MINEPKFLDYKNFNQKVERKQSYEYGVWSLSFWKNFSASAYFLNFGTSKID
jgi:hypothetical protein